MVAVQHVLILGGGTAGWLTAAFLARQLSRGAVEDIQITVLESSEIGIIGVGEGSFPSIKGTLDLLGIEERDFIGSCEATFKQGVQFAHWVRPPGQHGASHYFHPFNVPSQRRGMPELLPWWLRGAAGPGVAFADAVTMQAHTAAAGRAPKHSDDPPYSGPMNYAYHFDASALAGLLRTRAQVLGVRREIGTVASVARREDGAIDHLTTTDGRNFHADLFVDCSGFRARLIGEALGEPLRPLDRVLFADRAVAMPVPYAAADTPIATATIATAHEAGWTWDIGLQQRRGVGYVYSSAHQSDEAAEQTLRKYIGPAAAAREARRLTFALGYRERPWQHNCVAIGLAGGFLEPLESSGIGLIETAAYLLGFLFPRDGNFAPAARQFNTLMSARFVRIVDFLKLHYCLSQRTDSEFWRDNRDPASWTDSLQDLLARWRCRPPHRLDFIADLEMYPAQSWQFVLYGMEFPTRLAPQRREAAEERSARQEFQTLRTIAERATLDLPSHRSLIEHIIGRN